MTGFAPRIGDAIGGLVAGVGAALGGAVQGLQDAFAGAASNGAAVIVVGLLVALVIGWLVLRR